MLMMGGCDGIAGQETFSAILFGYFRKNFFDFCLHSYTMLITVNQSTG